MLNGSEISSRLRQISMTPASLSHDSAGPNSLRPYPVLSDTSEYLNELPDSRLSCFGMDSRHWAMRSLLVGFSPYLSRSSLSRAWIDAWTLYGSA